MKTQAHPVLARLYDPVMSVAERTVLEDHREYLSEGLHGRVLEIGAGTGAMFPYFAEAIEAGRLELTALEPDPYMRRQARERGETLGIDVALSDASAEKMPFEDGSFDAVVASFVFCTIPDHEAALTEAARVLEAGGEFRFLEHVRAEGVAGHLQDLFAPGWHAVAGGCHLNRTTGELFLRENAFQTREFTRRDGGLTSMFPMIRGRLERKPRSGIGTFTRLFGNTP